MSILKRVMRCTKRVQKEQRRGPRAMIGVVAVFESTGYYVEMYVKQRRYH